MKSWCRGLRIRLILHPSSFILRKEKPRHEPRLLRRDWLRAAGNELPWLRVSGVVVFEIVRNAEAGAGGGVHLLRGGGRLLQLRGAGLLPGKVLPGFVLPRPYSLPGGFSRCLVEIFFLIGGGPPLPT